MAENTENEPEASGAESMINRFYSFVDELDQKKRVTYGISWCLVAVVLIVAASIPLPEGLKWVAGVAGAPAGVIIFLLILAFIRTTGLRNLPAAKIREEKTPRRRLTVALSIVGVVALLLILTSAYIPFGVGGVAIVVAALSAFNIARRTPQEIAWARQGIPDPRELGDFDNDDDEYLDDDDYEEEDTRR
jgi:hypothetical protein